MDPWLFALGPLGPWVFLVQQTQSNQTVQDFQTRMRQCENTHLCVPLYSIDRLRLAQLLDFVYFIFIGCGGGGGAVMVILMMVIMVLAIINVVTIEYDDEYDDDGDDDNDLF